MISGDKSVIHIRQVPRLTSDTYKEWLRDVNRGYVNLGDVFWCLAGCYLGGV